MSEPGYDSLVERRDEDDDVDGESSDAEHVIHEFLINPKGPNSCEESDYSSGSEPITSAGKDFGSRVESGTHDGSDEGREHFGGVPAGRVAPRGAFYEGNGVGKVGMTKDINWNAGHERKNVVGSAQTSVSGRY